MTTQQDYINRATKLLNNELSDSAITRVDAPFEFMIKPTISAHHEQLNYLRALGIVLIEDKFPLANFLLPYAITICGIGRTRELTHRFVVDYLSEFNDLNLALIELNEPNHEENHHWIILVGPLVKNRLNQSLKQNYNVRHPDKNVLFFDFLQAQDHNTIIVDPFLSSIGTRHNLSPDSQQAQYYSRNKLTHVLSINDCNLPIFKNAATLNQVKEDANFLAPQMLRIINAPAQPSPLRTNSVFSQPNSDCIQSICASYEATNNPSLALRRATNSGTLNHVQTLVTAYPNIVNDAGPDSGKTALHFSVINNKVAITRFLVNRGADVNQLDNKGKSAIDYAKENNNETIENILLNQKEPIGYTSR